MIRLARPELGTAELEAVRAVLDTGTLVQGPQVHALETAFARQVGVACAVAVSSGTAALQLALEAAGLGPGDEVLVPDYTFVATANAVTAVGATPVLVDIDPQTLNMDPSDARAAVTERTRAMLPVHQFGLPAAMNELGTVAAEHGLQVIEDAACALGAEAGGFPCGSFGKLAAFSLHPRKIITSAEGGVIVTGDPDLAAKIHMLRNHGQHRTSEGIRVEMPGYNFRMSEVHAAIAGVQMKRLDAFIQKRRALARRYRKTLDVAGATLPPDTEHGGGHIYQSYVVVLPEGRTVTEIAPKLEEAGVECGFGTTRIGAQPAYADSARACPVAQSVAPRALSLPMHTQLTDKDIDQVCAELRKALS